jgi:hypothetical protein
VTQSLAVMQPTFLPWAGYFHLIAQADNFVFLDDVQLEKQSWQTRNRLLIAGRTHWITVPVRHISLSQTIAETEVVDTTHWRDKLLRGFAMNYGRHPYYTSAREVIDYLVAQPSTQLAELNESTIRFIVSRLQLNTHLHRASENNVDGERTERLVKLCRHFGATEYLSPQGAAHYLEEDGFAIHSPAKLCLQEYTPQPYMQKGITDFQSHLSIIDVIANIGWDLTRNYVQKDVFK